MIITFTILGLLGALILYALAFNFLRRRKRADFEMTTFENEYGVESDRESIAAAYAILTSLTDRKFERNDRLHEDLGILDDDVVIELNSFLRKKGVADIFKSKYKHELPISTVDDFVRLISTIVKDYPLP